MVREPDMAIEWSDHDLAYAAGFLDGEGNFYIGRYWRIRVSCSNTYRPIIY